MCNAAVIVTIILLRKCKLIQNIDAFGTMIWMKCDSTTYSCLTQSGLLQSTELPQYANLEVIQESIRRRSKMSDSEGPEQPKEGAMADRVLVGGWEQHCGEAGRMFYFNPVTKQSQWEPPSDSDEDRLSVVCIASLVVYINSILFRPGGPHSLQARWPTFSPGPVAHILSRPGGPHSLQLILSMATCLVSLQDSPQFSFFCSAIVCTCIWGSVA